MEEDELMGGKYNHKTMHGTARKCPYTTFLKTDVKTAYLLWLRKIFLILWITKRIIQLRCPTAFGTIMKGSGFKHIAESHISVFPKSSFYGNKRATVCCVWPVLSVSPRSSNKAIPSTRQFGSPMWYWVRQLPVLRRLRKKACLKFEVSLGYLVDIWPAWDTSQYPVSKAKGKPK